MNNHDKKHFFKYASANTAKLVLENASFKWTSADLFNDPFDHQSSFNFTFSHDELSKALAKRVIHLISKDNPYEDIDEATLISKHLIPILVELKRKSSLSEIESTFIGFSKEMDFEKYKKNLNQLILDAAATSRIFCVSEDNDNVVMWSHYADSHKGVCFRLDCIPDVDNVLLVAKKVEYISEFPEYLSLEQFVDYLIGINNFDIGDVFSKMGYLKHHNWSYEKEWRVIEPFSENNSGVSYYRENPRVFGAIYLGCNISENDRKELIDLINANYQGMKIFQAEKRTDKFGLCFSRIN